MGLARYGINTRAYRRLATSTTSTGRGGYCYPGTLSWSPVALLCLPSGEERYGDGISARALQATEHSAESQGCTALPLRSTIANSLCVPRSHVSAAIGYISIGLWLAWTH